MMPMSALKSMRVMFATPCYISAVSMNYVASMFSLALNPASRLRRSASSLERIPSITLRADSTRCAAAALRHRRP